MISSSGSSLFISLSLLLILKTIKILKNYYQSIVVMWQRMFSMPVMRTVWRRELKSDEIDEVVKVVESTPNNNHVVDQVIGVVRNLIVDIEECLHMLSIVFEYAPLST
jgi:hypothetical protein